MAIELKNGYFGTLPIITNNLVLALDAGNKKSYNGTGTTWTDLSGYGHHATFTNLATHNGEYFSFDGISNYATIDSNLQTLINNASEFTLIGIFNYKYFDHVDNIVGWGNANPDGGGVSRTWGFYNHSGTLKACYGTSALFGNATNLSNKWLFYVSRYTLTNIYADIYGSVSSSTSQLIATDTWKNIPTNYPITIGKTSYFSRYSECDIGVIYGYDRLLINSELEQNFNALKSRFNL